MVVQPDVGNPEDRFSRDMAHNVVESVCDCIGSMKTFYQNGTGTRIDETAVPLIRYNRDPP